MKNMKNLAIGAAVVAVVLAIILGVQVGQKNKLQTDLNDLQAASAAELMTVKESLEETQAKLEALGEERATLDTQLVEARKGVEEALAQVTTLSEENAGLLSSQVSVQLEEDKAALEEQVANLTKTGEEAATQLEAARKEAEDVKGNLAEVEKQLQEATQAKDALEAERATLMEQAAELEKKVAALEEDATKAVTKAEEDAKLVSELEVKAAEMEAKATEQESKAAEMEAKATELEAKAVEMETKATELEAKAAEMEAKATEQEARAIELEAKATEQEARAIELDALVAQKTAEAEEAAKQKGELEAEYQALLTKNEELTLAAAEGEKNLQAAVAAVPVETEPEAVEKTEQPEEEVAEVTAVALEPVSINIFHTNDVHSRVDGNDSDLIGYAKLATIVKEARAEGPVLLLDVGDVLHGMSFSTAVEGESMVELMNLVGVDAMTPGNHDFNYGYERLQELASLMNFPILNSNIVLEDGTSAFDPFTIKEVGGKRIALVGAGNPQMQSAIHPDRIKGLTFENEERTAKAVAEVLAEGPDAVIILAHWGADGAYDPNSSVLAKIPGVDLVIDGHSHTHYEDIQQVEGGAVIVSAYEYLKTLGHLVMTFDENNEVTIEVSPILFEDTVDVVPDPDVQKFIDDTKLVIEAATSEVVGKTNVRLEGAREIVRTQETNLGDLAADALRISTEADFAITNGGGIRTSVEIGDITKGNLIEVFPFGNSVVLIEVRGAQLLEAMEHGLRLYPEQNGGFPQISGGTLVFDPGQEPGARVVSLEVDGQPVDPNGTYLVSTNDFMAAGGDDYVMFKDSPVLLYGGTLDEALIAHIKDIGEINQEVDGRIQVLEAEEAPAEEEAPVEEEAPAEEVPESTDEGKAA